MSITSLSLTILNLANLIISILAILPLLVNANYYRKTKIFDYFLLSVYFLIWAIGAWITTLIDGIIIFEYQIKGITGKYKIFELIWFNRLNIIQTLDTLPLLLIAFRAKYGSELKNIPRKFRFLVFLQLIFAGFVVLTNNRYWLYQDILLSSSWTVTLTFNRIINHSIIIYCFLSTEYIQTRDSKLSKNLWIVSSAFWVFGLLIASIPIFFFGVDPFLDNAEFIGIPYIYLHLTFFSLVTLGYFLLLINHMFYPVSVLFTHEQIVRAWNLFDKFNDTIAQSKNSVFDFKLDKIKSYIENIPPDLKEKNQK